MKTFKKVGIAWLFFLLFYCSFLVSTVLFICQLGVSAVFYFSDGQFLFLWGDALNIALKKGCIAGFILGISLWIKARLQEHKDKKESGK
ncbi:MULTISPECIES: hypothetical protein [Pantoea]|jgi:hypothetical protein|uniref:Uncharacterized protein n=1 Tax=Pantoea brenneri TaxID=472694 RepID=A0A7Y6NF04_9GAMM|nr:MULTISPECIES: hypothetical protein [Pantoea]MBZ6395371.1 hypothetical protein [Pantoea sp.]MBZ6437255.1 hypothetical protein [Pantoea sp.]NUY42170.1 hypothetical protein [Pantoea brenneri]NUY49795.1 hypothetical protein [Pantoea brenneri]NUY60180.1 hypothetical protein [Pantoea brenneri]